MNEKDFDNLLTNCTVCPRNCHVNRMEGQNGYCGQSVQLRIARAALHHWEEPCLSGSNGSGTIFFSGCNLRCVFCQNYEIAIGQSGLAISQTRFVEILFELAEKGAHNINLVTPTHVIPQLVRGLMQAKKEGFSLPIIYNCGGYESVSSLRLLDGLIDIYLPDFKYYDAALSKQYANAPDYFEVACMALAEMYRQVKTPVFDPETGLMKRGMIVRHLLLPGETRNAKKILRYLHETYHNDIYISILNQYTPLSHVASFPSLCRKVTATEYARVLDFAKAIGIEQGFLQEEGTACESFIPPFDYEGIYPRKQTD